MGRRNPPAPTRGRGPGRPPRTTATLRRHSTRGDYYVLGPGKPEWCGTKDLAEAEAYLDLYRQGKTRAMRLNLRALLQARVGDVGKNKAGLLAYCGMRGRVGDIDPQWCRDYAPFRRKLAAARGEAVEDSTIRRELKLMLAAAREAAEEVQPDYRIAGWLPPEGAPRDDYLYADEFDLALHVALGRVRDPAGPDGWRRDPDHGGYVRDLGLAARWSPVARILMLGGYTATRRGRMEDARWEATDDHGHPDFEGDLFHRRGRREEGFGKPAGEVRMHRKLRLFLRICRARDRADGLHDPDAGMNGLIIHGPGGGRCWRVDALFQEVMAAAGIDEEITIHSLRHTVATWMLAAGVPERQVAEFLDVSVDVLLRTYAHVDWAMSGAVADAVDLAWDAGTFAAIPLAKLSDRPPPDAVAGSAKPHRAEGGAARLAA